MVYIVANRGVYGLPQSGLLANKLLEKCLNKRGYYQSKLVPGLWKHEWRPVQFALVVDDFGVKYVGEDHALHLKKTLQEYYTVTTEWEGKRYIGITIDWDYKRRQVHLSMPNYVVKALTQFQKKMRKKQHQHLPSAKIDYGAKKTVCHTAVNSATLGPKGKEIHTTGVWKFFLRPGSGQHTTIYASDRKSVV